MIKAQVCRDTLARAVWSLAQVEQKANDQITVIGPHEINMASARAPYLRGLRVRE